MGVDHPRTLCSHGHQYPTHVGVPYSSLLSLLLNMPFDALGNAGRLVTSMAEKLEFDAKALKKAARGIGDEQELQECEAAAALASQKAVDLRGVVEEIVRLRRVEQLAREAVQVRGEGAGLALARLRKTLGEG